jgi:hypothetical protein
MLLPNPYKAKGKHKSTLHPYTTITNGIKVAALHGTPPSTIQRTIEKSANRLKVSSLQNAWLTTEKIKTVKVDTNNKDDNEKENTGEIATHIRSHAKMRGAEKQGTGTM